MSTNPLSPEVSRDMARSICMNTGLLIMSEWVQTWEAVAKEKREAGEHQAAQAANDAWLFWRRIVKLAEEQR